MGNVWNFWRYGHLFLNRCNLAYDFHTSAPFGISYINYGIYVPARIFGALLNIITGDPILSYNLLIFFAYVFTFLTCYYLFKYLTQSPYASFIGSVIFTFCNYRNAQSMAHQGLISTYFLVLLVFLLLRIYPLCFQKYNRFGLWNSFLQRNTLFCPLFHLYNCEKIMKMETQNIFIRYRIFV